MKKGYLNLVVDHMTFLVVPRFYKVTYALFRVIFGVTPEDVLYEKRRKWTAGGEDKSMTFAARLGQYGTKKGLNQSIIAVVEPTEPRSRSSHVRQILKNRSGSAHWQHIALRTPDLLAFHKHALARGVNFITPILKDGSEDLIQVFSGEWNLPGGSPSGIFFEFVQRSPSKALVKKVETAGRETWFRDKTFLGLYAEKEREYQSGTITPFIDEKLFLEIEKLLEAKALWEIGDGDIRAVEKAMMAYAKSKTKARSR